MTLLILFSSPFILTPIINGYNYLSFTLRDISPMMSDNQYELVQNYINTQEYLTIKIYDSYLLFHRNIIQHSHNRELGLGRNSK
jgi:hypothetical protein